MPVARSPTAVPCGSEAVVVVLVVVVVLDCVLAVVVLDVVVVLVVVVVVGAFAVGFGLIRTQRQTRRWCLRWQTCTRPAGVFAWPRLAATRLDGTSMQAASASATRLT
jgi:hypothetical protein